MYMPVCTSGCVSWVERMGEGRHGSLLQSGDRGKGSSRDGGGSPVSDVEERQHCPLPQAQAFSGGNVPDHPALLVPGFVLHQHQGDISPQGPMDEPGHSEL